MRFGIVCVLLSVLTVVKCDDNISLLNDLNDLKALDFFKLFTEIISKNLTDFDDITESRLTGDNETHSGRNYNWNKCAIEIGSIAAGLRQTEWWAMQCKYFFLVYR